MSLVARITCFQRNYNCKVSAATENTGNGMNTGTLSKVIMDCPLMTLLWREITGRWLDNVSMMLCLLYVENAIEYVKPRGCGYQT